MAVVRARALAVAAGVPAAFALLAALLTASPAATAAAEPAGTRSGGSSGTPSGGFSVTHPYVGRSVPAVPRHFTIRTDDPVAFITIDDGVHTPRAALRFVQEHQVPITAFVSAWTVKDRTRIDYFAAITQWGSVQNHSATHASLARSRTDLDHEICYPQRAFARDFGRRPWLLRPPYGEGSERLMTQVTARRCGISDIVLWDAVVEDGVVVPVGNGLKPGSVLLLHFGPDLAADLRAAVRAVHSAGLTPASIADYLPEPS